MTNPFLGNPFADLTEDLEDDPFADLTADLKPKEPPKITPLPTVRVTADAPRNPIAQGMARAQLAQRGQLQEPRKPVVAPPRENDVGLSVMRGLGEGVYATAQGFANLADKLPGIENAGESVRRQREEFQQYWGNPETGLGVAAMIGGNLASYGLQFMAPGALAGRLAQGAQAGSTAARALQFLQNPLGKLGTNAAGQVNFAGRVAAGTVAATPANIGLSQSPEDAGATQFKQLGEMMEGKPGILPAAARGLGRVAEPFADTGLGRFVFETGFDLAGGTAFEGAAKGLSGSKQMIRNVLDGKPAITPLNIPNAPRMGAERARPDMMPSRMPITDPRRLLPAQAGTLPTFGQAPLQGPPIPMRGDLANPSEPLIKAEWRGIADQLDAEQAAGPNAIEIPPVFNPRTPEQQLDLRREMAGSKQQLQADLDDRRALAMPDMEATRQLEMVNELGKAQRAAQPQSPILRPREGKVDPVLMQQIAGGGIGAAAGATQGDTPEERLRNAALGGAVGAGLPRMAGRGVGLSTEDVSQFATRLYSRLGRQIDNAPFERGTAEQWAAALSKGTAKAEREFTGVDAFLKENAGKVLNRAEVKQVFDANRVQLGETQYGYTLPQLTMPESRHVSAYFTAFERANPSASFDELKNEAMRLLRSTPAGSRIPEESLDDAAVDLVNSYDVGIRTRPFEQKGDKNVRFESYRVPGEQTNYREVMIQKPGDEVFRYTTHWDEPNVMTHVRMSDRVIDGKKTLFVEELQDDWAQQARDRVDTPDGEEQMRGYRTPEQDAEIAALAKQVEQQKQVVRSLRSRSRAARDKFDALNRTMRNTDDPAVREQMAAKAMQYFDEEASLVEPLRQANNDYAMLIGRMDNLNRPTGPLPNRPFKQTPEWTELGLKRALDEAVQKGYDQVALVTGEQAGDMFDLRQTADRLFWTVDDNDPRWGRLQGFKDGREVLDKSVRSSALKSYVGAGVAKELQFRAGQDDGLRGMIEGDDIRNVGGKGMQTFYDEMVPNVIRDYSKKLGVPLTVRRGAGGPGLEDLQNELAQLKQARTRTNVREEVDAINQRMLQIRDVEIPKAEQGTGFDGNLVIEITPQLREKILTEGQPLWDMGSGQAAAAALGAGAGASEGETTEDRLGNALLMAGVVGGVSNRSVLRNITDKVLGQMAPKVAQLVKNLDPETGYAPQMYASLRAFRDDVRAIGRNPEALRARGAAQAALAQQIRQGIEQGELGPQHAGFAEVAERMARAMEMLAKNAEQAPSEAVKGTKTVLQAHRDEVAKRLAENPELARIGTEGTVQEKVQAVVDFAAPILKEAAEKAIREHGTDAKWYDDAVRNMQSLATLVMPELSEPRLFMLFNYMGSILSNGNPVSSELGASIVAMQQYLRTGKFSVFAQDPKGGYSPTLRVKSTSGSGVTERPMFSVADDGDVLKGGPKFRSWEASLKKMNEVMERHGGDVESALKELTGRGFKPAAESRIKGLMKQGKTFDEAVQIASVDAKGRPVEIYAAGDAKNRLRSTQLFGPKVGQYGTDKTMWLRGEVDLPFPQGVRENATNDLWMARLYNMALGQTPLSPKGALSDNVTGPMHTVLNEVQRRLGREVGMEVLGRPMDARNVQALLWEAMKSRYGALGVKVEKGAFDTMETAAVNYLFNAPSARGVDEVEAIARKGLSGYRPGFIDRQLMNEIAGKGTLVAGGLAMRGSDDERLRMTGNAAIGAALGSLAYRGALKPLAKAGAAGLADGLRQSEGGRQALTLLSRDLTTDPRVTEVVEQFRQMLAKGTAIGQELGGEARKLGPKGSRVVSDLQEGEAFESVAGMSPEDMALATALANRIGDAVQVMGQDMVDAGLISSATYAKRPRSYMRRMYAKYDAADATEDVAANAKGKTFRIEGPRIRNDELTPEERLAMGEIREMDYRAPETFRRNYRDIASAKLFNALRDMPGVLHPDYATAAGEAMTAKAFHRELLAEYKAATTAAERARIAPLRDDAYRAMMEAQGRVRELQGRFKESAPADMRSYLKRAGKDDYVRLPDTPSMGELRGAVVRRDVADYLNDLPEMSAQSSAFGRLMSNWKVIHTVYNTGTQIGNFVSNVTNAHMGGIPWWMQPKAMFWDSAVKDLREYGPATRALAEAGILDRGLPLYGDLPSKGLYDDKLALRQLATTTRPETRAKIEEAGLTPMGKGEQALRKADAKIKQSYALGDGIYRVMLMRKYLKDGLSTEDALKKVVEFMPTYDTRSPLLKGLKGTVSPFIMYTAKNVPMLLDKIMEHPERWATLAATWAVVDQWSRRKYGAMDEEDLPPNQRMGKTGYFLPQRIQVDALMRPFMDIPANRHPTIDVARYTPLAALTGSPAPGSLATQLGENVPGILQPGGPWVSLGAQFTNTDPFTGEKLIRPSDNNWDKAKKLGMAAASYVTPSFLSFHTPRVIDDLQAGDPQKAAVDALGILGMRPTMVEPGMQALRDLRRFEDQRRDNTIQFRRDLRDTKDPERRDEIRKKYRENMQRFRQELQERRGR